jgi:SAM-dependent methyltransferase
VECDSAPENTGPQAGQPGRAGLLPFTDGAFDLVINRHESFRADEAGRVLAPGGTFVTQQVDYHNDDDLYLLLGLRPPQSPGSWLRDAAFQLTAAGLTVRTATASDEVRYFHDIAAVVYYLKVIAWAIPGYSLDEFRPRLRAAFDAKGNWPMPVRHRRFLVVAGKLAR